MGSRAPCSYSRQMAAPRRDCHRRYDFELVLFGAAHPNTRAGRGSRLGLERERIVMNIFILYLLLLKATVTSFSGLGSLPVIRQDLVVTHQVLTDYQLNAAVAIGRTTPGPAGLYVVSVGYFAAGVPGAIAGWLALVTPSLSVILFIRYLGRKAEHPRVKDVLQAIVLASAGMLLATALPLARDAVSGVLLSLIALLSVLVLVFTKLDSIWVILGSAIICLVAGTLRLILSI